MPKNETIINCMWVLTATGLSLYKQDFGFAFCWPLTLLLLDQLYLSLVISCTYKVNSSINKTENKKQKLYKENNSQVLLKRLYYLKCSKDTLHN